MPSNSEAMQSSKSILEKRWSDAVALSENELGEEDFFRLSEIKDAKELVSLIEEMCSNEYNKKISYYLNFYISKVPALGAALQVALGNKSRSYLAYWGVVHLMLELAARSEVVLSRLTTLWTDVANNLHAFEAYSPIIEQDTHLREVVLEVLLEFFSASVAAVRVIKLTPTRVSSDYLDSHTEWMQLTGKYKSILNSLSQTVYFIKESSEAKMIQEEKKREEIFSRLTHLPTETESDESSIAKLSIQESDTPQGYYYVPFRHNQNFFGREELLLEIEQKLESRDDALRSLSIWGTGGVGKTQIALEFAYRQHRKGVKYILWIPSEHHSESAKAFTQVAGLLKLSGATTSKGHEQNKLLVLHFLQHTSKRLVYR
ncbi:hypothetical protein ACHAO4_003621 [Trichoderma viride]